MSADIQVVEVGEKNSLVPNLTISVDNEEGEKDLPEIEYNNEPSEEIDMEKTEVKRRLNLFPRKKMYENNRLDSTASLGLSFEEAEARRKKRAARFQSPLTTTEEKVSETPEELLAKSQVYTDRISQFNKDISLDDEEFIRLDALHIEGVDSMSTNEIFAYFGRTNPHHIEWVNDHSCNVVWGNAEDARISMEMVALPYTSEKTQGSEPPAAFDDDLDLDIDTGTRMEVEDSKPNVEIPMNPVRKCIAPYEDNKTKAFLLIRFATMNDRKEKFAAKKSSYYVKHGNPHYGGARGLLTSSYRRRYQMKRAMKEFRSLNPDTEEGMESKRSRVEQPDAETEKKDETLIHSTVKDLDDDCSSDESDVAGFGTMMADQVSQRVKAVRDMSERLGTHGGPQVTGPSNRVHTRLGARNTHSSQSDPTQPSGRALNRVERRLRPSGLRSDRMSPQKRELKRYSPPPWE